MKDLNNSDELTLSMRQVQAFVALCLFGSFGFFALGYFFGQQHALRTLVENVSNTVVSDQINTHFYQNKFLEAENSSDNSHDEKTAIAEELLVEESVAHLPAVQSNDSIIHTEKPHESISFYAPLVGYGTLKAAEQFMKRWPDAPIMLKKQISRSAKGKQVTWYQIVTEPFADRNELQNFVEHIQKKERLKDVIKIVPIKS